MWRAWMLVVVAGCGGDDQPMRVDVPIAPPEQPPVCTAFISWTAPTEREDGVPFNVEEIEKYDLFIGLESGDWYRIVGVDDGSLTDWEEAGLLGGDNYFTMTVTDTEGLESIQADEVIKFVDSRCN